MSRPRGMEVVNLSGPGWCLTYGDWDIPKPSLFPQGPKGARDSAREQYVLWGGCALCGWCYAFSLVVREGLKGESYTDGRTIVLGLREGATENASVVSALLQDLEARGLDFSVPRLYVLDGGKALAVAVRRHAGEAALIQRWQVSWSRRPCAPD